MLAKLRLSSTKQIEDIEQSTFAMLVLYGSIGYLTVGVIALPLNAYRNGTLSGYQILATSVAGGFLLFFYYTRYRMIVDDKNDGD